MYMADSRKMQRHKLQVGILVLLGMLLMHSFTAQAARKVRPFQAHRF